MIIDLKKIIDETVGGKKDSNKPISSGALYNTMNQTNPSTMWILISEKIVSNNYGQKIWYQPMTGMVEAWFVSPARQITGSYTEIYTRQEYLDTTKLQQAGIDTTNISFNDFMPLTAIHGIGRGAVGGSTKNIVVTLEKNGTVYGKTFDGTSSTTSRRYDMYFTYRCKLGHTSTDFNDISLDETSNNLNNG